MPKSGGWVVCELRALVLVPASWLCDLLFLSFIICKTGIIMAPTSCSVWKRIRQDDISKILNTVLAIYIHVYARVHVCVCVCVYNRSSKLY